MKDAAVKAEEDRKNAIRIKEEKQKKYNSQLLKLEKEYHEKLEAFQRREYSYGPIAIQLDMLWHDMDDEKIKIDKDNANTWYQVIKKSKELTPLPSSWREDLYSAHEEMTHHTMANNNIENV